MLFIWYLANVIASNILGAKSHTQVIRLVTKWINIDHFFSRFFSSSYRKLAWVGFEPKTNEFRSDALTDWVIRPCVQLAFRTNFVQLLQFHLSAQCSHAISTIVFVSHYICFKRSLAQEKRRGERHVGERRDRILEQLMCIF